MSQIRRRDLLMLGGVMLAVSAIPTAWFIRKHQRYEDQIKQLQLYFKGLDLSMMNRAGYLSILKPEATIRDQYYIVEYFVIPNEFKLGGSHVKRGELGYLTVEEGQW